MSRLHVFLKAPTARQLKEGNGLDGYQWRTIQSGPSSEHSHSRTRMSLLPETFQAASRRISMLYENIIFKETPSDEDSLDVELDPEGRTVAKSEEPTTFITWPLTLPQDRSEGNESVPGSMRETTFLRPSQSFFRSAQETQETNSFSYSQQMSGDSDASVTHFPSFHFALQTLSSLAALGHTPAAAPRVSYPFAAGKRRANILVVVLELEGPDAVRIKRGADAGREVALLKVVVGDQDGGIARLVAWREVAEQWGGTCGGEHSPAIKKGDVVYMQNVLVSKEDTPAADERSMSTISLTASPALGSTMTVCYRTMPWGDDPADEKLRPDLRLGYSDAAVRKVATLVHWFQSTAGLPVLE